MNNKAFDMLYEYMVRRGCSESFAASTVDWFVSHIPASHNLWCVEEHPSHYGFTVEFNIPISISGHCYVSNGLNFANTEHIRIRVHFWAENDYCTYAYFVLYNTPDDDFYFSSAVECYMHNGAFTTDTTFEEREFIEWMYRHTQTATVDKEDFIKWLHLWLQIKR